MRARDTSVHHLERARITGRGAVITLFVVCLRLVASIPCHADPPPNLRIAFIGDQGLDADAQAVLTMIRDEGASAVMHSGDFDYEDNPEAWNHQIDAILGPNFP